MNNNITFGKKHSKQNKNNKELLEKIGELYFKNNNINLSYRHSDKYIKFTWLINDLKDAYLNIISIIINIILGFIIFFWIPKTFLFIILFAFLIFLILALEFSIFVPAYSRKTPLETIKLHYRLIALKLIAILKFHLHHLLCNADGSVKKFTLNVSAVFFCNQLGSKIGSYFGIDPEIVQLIILYFTNNELDNFCSIIPTEIDDIKLRSQLLNLKEEMLKIAKNNHKK
ncbi:MAG: hypothetical protein IKB71_06635 [Lentisphaeria bacterium]|nr:hypothetical protein [Lentisphaeria bacterium]